MWIKIKAFKKKQKQGPGVEAKENIFILYFPSAGDVHPFLEKKWLLRKANVLLMSAPYPSFPLSYGVEYPFSQFGSAALAMCPFKVLSPPKLLMRSVGDTALMLWRAMHQEPKF